MKRWVAVGLFSEEEEQESKEEEKSRKDA